MAGDGFRGMVGLRRSTDGRGIAPTTIMPTPSDAHVMGFSDLCINSLLHLRLDTWTMIWKLLMLKQRQLHREVLGGSGGVGPLPTRCGAALHVSSIGLMVVSVVNFTRGIVQTHALNIFQFR